MKNIFVVVALLAVSYAYAQTCVVPAPPAPPVPRELRVQLPTDGGGQGCTVQAIVPGSGASPGTYSVSNAKCAQAVAIAQQAAANDNGWNDGGTP